MTTDPTTTETTLDPLDYRSIVGEFHVSCLRLLREIMLRTGLPLDCERMEIAVRDHVLLVGQSLDDRRSMLVLRCSTDTGDPAFGRNRVEPLTADVPPEMAH